MISATHPCPSCGKDCTVEESPHTVRRGDKFVTVTWHQYVCHNGCLSVRNDDPLAFVTIAAGNKDCETAEQAWRRKYGESIPKPGKRGRPHRAGSPSSERVPVMFTEDELEEIDRRRGNASRSAYIRQVALGQRQPG